MQNSHKSGKQRSYAIRNLEEAGKNYEQGADHDTEVRRRLGVRAGDRLQFEEDGKGMRVTAVRKESVFEKYRGIGNPGIGKGRKAIQKWMHELRGYDEE